VTCTEETALRLYDTVLCPTDLSDTGNRAVGLAYRIAASGGVVHLLHVCEPPHLGNPLYEQYVHGYVPTPEESDAGRERVKEQLHDLRPGDALEQGIRTEFHLIEGTNVANEIRDQARAVGAGVIVMGTHGRSGLGRLIMGSVATDVVQEHEFPVILFSEAHEED